MLKAATPSKDVLLTTAAVTFSDSALGDELRMLDIKEVCQFFGGLHSPLHPTTLYKGIKSGKYPPPVKQGKQTSRWVLGICREYLRKLIAAQNEKAA